MVVERNIRNAADRSDVMQDIYLDKEQLNEIKDTVEELGVSL